MAAWNVRVNSSSTTSLPLIMSETPAQPNRHTSTATSPRALSLLHSRLLASPVTRRRLMSTGLPNPPQHAMMPCFYTLKIVLPLNVGREV
jgi:hypothetical protein